MKKVILLLTVVMMSACSSLNPKPETLKAAPVCTVWKENVMGIRYPIEIKGEVAEYNVTCWLWNMYLCKTDQYRFISSNEIQSKMLGEKASAKVDGNKVTMKMWGSTIEPFEIKEKGKIHYTIQGPIGPKHTDLVEYNDKCTTRQAVVGMMAVMAK